MRYSFLLGLIMLSINCSGPKHEDFEQEFNKKAQTMAATFPAPVISPSDLYAAYQATPDKYILLDTRELEEFKVSHLKNARSVSYKDFDLDTASGLLQKDKIIIVYCSLGRRSGEVAEQLTKAGYKAHNLIGGIFAWANANYPLVDNENRPTQLVHGYNKKWSKWVKRQSQVLLP